MFVVCIGWGWYLNMKGCWLLCFFRAGLIVYLCKQFCVCVSSWILFVKRECVFWCSVSFCFCSCVCFVWFVEDKAGSVSESWVWVIYVSGGGWGATPVEVGMLGVVVVPSISKCWVIYIWADRLIYSRALWHGESAWKRNKKCDSFVKRDQH